MSDAADASANLGREVAKFTRKKELRVVRELGRGACGVTLLLHDDAIDQLFVCKKYSPLFESMRSELFENFVREIKILHLLNHVNVVRVFNYYLYPDRLTGYILMEEVAGVDVEQYVAAHPDEANNVFMQVIAGFEHLEQNGILHRDVRPQNILVSDSGVAKIIDFGFGKHAIVSGDYEKSVSLNWWCPPPAEFASGVYDHATDVYFVGRLFEKILRDAGVGEFGYQELLSQMTDISPMARLKSFRLLRQQMLASSVDHAAFVEGELSAYRNLADALSQTVSKLERGSTYRSAADVERKLDDLFRRTMLERCLPSNDLLGRCFIDGNFYFTSRVEIEVSVVSAFLQMLRRASRDKIEIIMSNLQTRLGVLPKYDENADFADDDIPF